MILVFGSFMFGGARELAEFGFGLAFSVLVDALLIRSLLVPALMHLIGPANWALPRLAGPDPAAPGRRGSRTGPGHPSAPACTLAPPCSTVPATPHRSPSSAGQRTPAIPRRAISMPELSPRPGHPQSTGTSPGQQSAARPSRPRWKFKAAAALLSAAGTGLLLTACSSTASTIPAAAGPLPAANSPAAGGIPQGAYVALGDSYAAGPDIPGQVGATAGCEQSSGSYPYLVAQRLRLRPGRHELQQRDHRQPVLPAVHR